jgi:hypothetical protein
MRPTAVRRRKMNNSTQESRSSCREGSNLEQFAKLAQSTLFLQETALAAKFADRYSPAPFTHDSKVQFVSLSSFGVIAP